MDSHSSQEPCHLHNHAAVSYQDVYVSSQDQRIKHHAHQVEATQRSIKEEDEKRKTGNNNNNNNNNRERERGEEKTRKKREESTK